ncbi:hypothetical protein EGJ34_01930 [Stenotrophomonas sp. 278]|nr:hypothetical protein EGJ34_01930 [Stenotrophomonas sp. 278]
MSLFSSVSGISEVRSRCIEHSSGVYMYHATLMPEWSRHTLEVLREPLESGHVNVARAARTDAFPARFQLVAAIESSI